MKVVVVVVVRIGRRIKIINLHKIKFTHISKKGTKDVNRRIIINNR